MEIGNLADWTSAVGSFLAVSVSVCLYAASQRDRRASEMTSARSAALLVLPKFREAGTHLTWAVNQLREGHNPSSIGTDEMGKNFSIGYLRLIFDRFESTLPAIAQLGHASHGAQSAFHHFRALSDNLAEYIATDMGPDENVSYKGNAWVTTNALLQKTDSKMLKAVTEMEHLLR